MRRDAARRAPRVVELVRGRGADGPGTRPRRGPPWDGDPPRGPVEVVGPSGGIRSAMLDRQGPRWTIEPIGVAGLDRRSLRQGPSRSGRDAQACVGEVPWVGPANGGARTAAHRAAPRARTAEPRSRPVALRPLGACAPGDPARAGTVAPAPAPAPARPAAGGAPRRFGTAARAIPWTHGSRPRAIRWGPRSEAMGDPPSTGHDRAPLGHSGDPPIRCRCDAQGVC